MLRELSDMLLATNKQYTPYFIWKNYRRLDNDGNVDELDFKTNVNALTNLIQIARYAFNKNERLFTLSGIFAQRFSLYAGSTNHKLSKEQVDLMKRIAEYMVDEGAISTTELNVIDTDLWRSGIKEFGPVIFASEMQMLSRFVIGV